MLKINGDLFRTIVLTLLAGLSVVVVAMANRDVYSKEILDVKFDNIKMRQLHMEDDIQWIVRTMGGTPSVDTNKDSSTSQPD